MRQKETLDVVSTSSLSIIVCLITRKELVVETADGTQKKIYEIVEVCTIIIGGKEFPLSENDAQRVCNKKTIKVQASAGKSLSVRGDRKKGEIGIISMLKVMN
ncbi:hypothetical protein OSB04_030628 [Centaurea solstitialis]|uniref:Uncharacterized protein n=1 Tax=Centaurea solstitialis TaxID=347529 RepID=A0AA38SKM8_9ASTR|nr:hypothetical protein OSB04_030628 [Centaurea solstitialis]